MWRVYIIQCRDDTLYTGITNDLDRRVKEHNAGRGALFTKFRRPVKLVYYEDALDRSAALRREFEIKKLRREDKLRLVNSSGLFQKAGT